MKRLSLLLISIITISFFGCSENEIVKKYGGKSKVKLKPNNILISATFKGDDLWYCTRDTITGISYLTEKSKYGILEGEFIFEK